MTEARSSVDDDIRCVERVLAGDIDAFEGIVVRWQGPLIGLAYRYCRDRSRAEDLAQEAFLRAFRALRGWRREGAFSTWLFALALNHYRNSVKRLPPPPIALDAIVPRAAIAPPSGSDDDDASRDRAIRDAVSALPMKYRDALLLYYFQERDVDAAAGMLGVPSGTLKARLSRGRDLLRKKLAVLWERV